VSIGSIRRLYGVGAAIGLAVMFARDVLAEVGPSVSRLTALIVVVALSGVVTYALTRRIRRSNAIDERVTQIQRAATKNAFRGQTFGIAIAFALVTFAADGGSIGMVLLADRLPVEALLGVILVGSLGVYEFSIEYYRRRM